MQASSLQKRRVTGAHAFFLGAFLALLALTPAILPYGGRFVTRGDFIEQQLPFILETRRILRSGLNSYSFNTFLGAPAVGSYAFYTLGSVFVWPLALLPKALIPFGISVMAVLKHAVCALTSFCYLRRMVKEERLALLGSVLYTFSAFTIVNTQFYHFLEVIAFFPLILLGMEDAMSDHPRRGLLALFCGLNTLTNYYFMLSSALLAALYFVFRFFSADWKPRRTFKNVFMLIFECGAGCALAGVLLVPSMLFMLSITRTGAGDTSVLMQHYSASTLLERLRALIMPIESNVVHAYYGDAPSWASTAAYLPLFRSDGRSFRLCSEEKPMAQGPFAGAGCVLRRACAVRRFRTGNQHFLHPLVVWSCADADAGHADCLRGFRRAHVADVVPHSDRADHAADRAVYASGKLAESAGPSR